MSTQALLATAGVLVVGTVDTLLALRVLRAYRKARRTPHLWIAVGIGCSFAAVVGATIVFAAEGMPELRSTSAWVTARWLGFLGAAASYGMVGVFAASAFGRSRAVGRAAWSALALLVGLAAWGVVHEPPEAGTVATTTWTFRAPFVVLSLSGSCFGCIEALSLARAYGRAGRAGRWVDRMALGRMRMMGRGFASMALGQLALLGFAPGGRFDTPVGYACVTALMLGALGFVLACVGTWATPAFLRTRWANQ